jgi:hypothetical protein
MRNLAVMSAGQRPRGDERIDQSRRHDEVTEPERREQYLAERPGVDQAARRVEPLEGGEGAARVPVLAVVVVLEDPGSTRARPLEEREPPVEAHRHAERVLMGRRDVDQPGPGGAARAAPDVEPLPVHRHGLKADPRRDEGSARPLIARVLDPGRITGIEEHPRGEIHRLLRAGHDDHLRCLAAHGARLAEVRRDRLAERGVARRIAVVQELPRDAPPAPGDEPRPEVEREGVESGQPRPERVGRGGATREGGARADEERATPGQARAPAGRVGTRGFRARAEERLQERPHHRGPRPHAAFQVAFGEELPERGEHGVARGLEIARQHARGWQARPGAEAAREDRLAQTLVELTVERHARGALEAERPYRHDGPPLRHLASTPRLLETMAPS